MALPAGRKGVLPSELTPEGKIKQPTPYELPTASSEVLGGIKVGNGLSISNGVLAVAVIVPAFTSEDAGKVLAVNSNGDGLEWKTLV